MIHYDTIQTNRRIDIRNFLFRTVSIKFVSWKLHMVLQPGGLSTPRVNWIDFFKSLSTTFVESRHSQCIMEDYGLLFNGRSLNPLKRYGYWLWNILICMLSVIFHLGMRTPHKVTRRGPFQAFHSR